jgi:hypothetical protein
MKRLLPCLPVLVALVALPVLAALALPVAASAAEAPCPNEALRQTQPKGLRLPDCRAYEQVSPTDKGGQDAIASHNAGEASPSGDAIYYISESPFPELPAPEGASPVYISTHPDPLASWSTMSAYPELKSRYVAFDEDLNREIIEVEGETPEGVPIPPGEVDVYVRENDLSDGAPGAYRLLVGGLKGATEGEFWLAGFSGDGTHVFFESPADLLPGVARAGAVNAYEIDLEKPPAEQLSLAGVLPAGEGGEAPPEGSSAGGYDGLGHHPDSQSRISVDGSRVFFQASPSGRLYVRENAGEPASPVGPGGECTVAADACSVAVSPGAATFREATPDGRFVFYTEGEDLYRFDTQTQEHETVAGGPEAAGGKAGVLGILGASADGSTVYFAATGALTGSEKGPGGEIAEEREVTHPGGGNGSVVNLYRWHQEGAGGSAATLFIANLVTNVPYDRGDDGDWADGTWAGNEEHEIQPLARVTPDGGTVLFAKGWSPSYTFFRYRVAEGGRPASLLCVTCYPAGSPPTVEASAELSGYGASEAEESSVIFSPRSLSVDGDRVFFDSPDPLLGSGSTPGGAINVYEWEADGEGSCRSEAQDGGCLFLISTGTETQESYFVDASANGDDAFFLTRERLASSDEDSNFDVYDASVDAGACGVEGYPECPKPPKPRVVCVSAEECKPPPSEPPAEAFPATAAFSGPGNLVALPEQKSPPTEITRKVTRAQKLATALRACRKEKSAKRRVACEKAARKRYAPHAKARPGKRGRR